MLHPYKIQLVKELKLQDTTQKLEFVSQTIQRFQRVRLFRNEAHFHLNGHVNTQNCMRQRLFRSRYELLLFLKMHAVTVISVRYVEMLGRFLVPKL